MPRLTPIPWRLFEKFVLAQGCVFKRERGDHRIYWKEGMKRPIVIPRRKQLPVFIIRNNLRLLQITPKEYLDIVKTL